MREQEIPENYPRCRFCGEPMGDGGLILEDEVCSSPGLLTVCDACSRLIDALVEDALPDLLRRIMNKAEKPLRERLSAFDYKNWQNHIEKKADET